MVLWNTANALWIIGNESLVVKLCLTQVLSCEDFVGHTAVVGLFFIAVCVYNIIY